jgi:hypothetical protein
VDFVGGALVVGEFADQGVVGGTVGDGGGADAHVGGEEGSGRHGRAKVVIWSGGSRI